MIFNEPMKLDLQKVIEERQKPLKNISAGYEEIRKVKEAKKKEEKVQKIDLTNGENMTTEQKLELLTKAVAELTIKLEEKGM
jgi:predicted Zn-dependent protease